MFKVGDKVTLIDTPIEFRIHEKGLIYTVEDTTRDMRSVKLEETGLLFQSSYLTKAEPILFHQQLENSINEVKKQCLKPASKQIVRLKFIDFDLPVLYQIGDILRFDMNHPHVSDKKYENTRLLIEKINKERTVLKNIKTSIQKEVRSWAMTTIEISNHFNCEYGPLLIKG